MDLPRVALIDTNILLLYFVGSFRRDLIGKHRRVQKFAPEDFDLLLSVFSYFNKLVTTPNVLTEVNNLSPDGLGPAYFAKFAEGIALLEEEYTPGVEIAQTRPFLKLGLTDAGIISAAVGRYVVITDDFTLRQFLMTAGGDVLNFDDLRSRNWNRRI